jgi:TP901 family phage tail tape measure protein
MAEDVQSNIGINIDASNALASLKLLQQQISAFHTSLAKGSADAAAASNILQQKLVNSINATGKFSASMQTVKTTTESFTTALEKNQLSLGQYFRYAGASTKTFGSLFKSEFDTINKVARERVKDLQTQYIKMGRDANGAMKAISVRPLMLDMDSLATKTQIAAQRQALLNQLLKQGSTNLLNFGKNTQWAGRQLMVGFTVPLMMAGTAAVKAYTQIEQASIRIKRVYGDMNTTAAETNKMVGQIKSLATEYTKYGVAVADTMNMAADAAAMGKTGADLLAQINNATKLSVLGGVDQQTALQTTISLTNAFGISADQLAKKINFLNSVENQTSLSIEDMTTAIPKAAPVVKQLGGSVEDLAYFLTAMKEGGVNASEGANALKSGLSNLINPTKKASDFLQGFGVNVKGIVEGDKGNLKQTVLDFATALNKIDPLNRARAIEMMFGKFQFARISTLFQNITKEGSQAQTVMGLAKTSSEALAILSEREMKKVSDSPLYKFQKAVESLKMSLVPLGEAFLKAVTPLVKFGTDVLKRFEGLNDGVKSFIVNIVGIAGVIAPALLMGFGLVANGVANVIKFFSFLKAAFNGTASSSTILGEKTQYMTEEQLKAAAVAASLEQVHSNLTQTFSSEAEAVGLLTAAYQKAVIAQGGFSGFTGGMPAAKGRKKFATGGTVPGQGDGDVVPAMLTPGEFIVPKAKARKYSTLLSGIIAGTVQGYEKGGTVTYGGGSQNFPHKTTVNRIQELIDTLDNADGMITEAFKRMSANGETRVRDFKTHMAAIAKEQGRSKDLSPAFATEYRYSASHFGEKKTPQDQLIKEMEAEHGDLGRRAAKAEIYAYNAERSAIRKELMSRGASEQQILSALSPNRGHVRQTSKEDPEAWKSHSWQLETNLINNSLVNSLAPTADAPKKGEAARKLLGDYMVKSGVAVKDATAILEKLKANVSPSIEELKLLQPALTKMRDDIDLFNRDSSKGLNWKTAGLTETFANVTVPGAVAGIRAKSAAMDRLDPKLRALNDSRLAAARAQELKQVEAQAEAEVVARRNAVAKTKNPKDDLYPATRDRKSPHRLTTVDGEDDARAYVQAAAAQVDKTPIPSTTGSKFKGFFRNLTSTGPISGRIASGAMAATMGLGAAAMIPGQTGQVAQGLLGPVGAVAAAFQFLPPQIAIAVTAIGALGYGIYSMIDSFNKAQDKALALGNALGTSVDATKKYSEITGQVSASEIMDLRRRNSTSLFQSAFGKPTFGDKFIGTEQGTNLYKAVAASIASQGIGGTARNLQSQMSSAISTGQLTVAQASSIVDSIAAKLGEKEMGMGIIGNLNSIFGPNGENLLKDPLKLRVNLIQSTGSEFSSVGGGALANASSIQGQQLGAAGMGTLRAGVYGTAAGMAVKQFLPNVAASIGESTVGKIVQGAVAKFGTRLLASEAISAATGVTEGTLGIGAAVVGVGTAAVSAYETFKDIQSMNEKIATSTGEYAASAQNALQSNKGNLDAMELSYQTQLAQLTAAGKTAEAEKLTTAYYIQRTEALKSNKQLVNDIAAGFKKADSGFLGIGDVKGAMTTSVEKQINTIGENTGQTGTAKNLIENINNAKGQDFQKYAVKSIVAGGQLNFAQGQSFLDIFGKGTKGQDMTVGLNIVGKFGGPLAGQMLDIAKVFTAGSAQQKTFITNFKTMGVKDATEALGVFNMLQQTATSEVDLKAKITYYSNPENLKKFQGQMKEINALAKSGKLNINSTLAQKVKIDSAGMAALKANQKYFSGLSSSQKVVYMQSFITSYATVTDDQALQYLDTHDKSYFNAAAAGPKKMAAARAAVAAENAKLTADAYKAAGLLDTGGTTGGATGGSTTPATSMLDSLVKKFRDLGLASQTLTSNLKDSRNALTALAKISDLFTKNTGLEEQLKKFGVGSELSAAIMGLSQKDMAAMESVIFTHKKGKKATAANRTGLTKEFQRINAQNDTLNVEGKKSEATKAITDIQTKTKAYDILISKGADVQTAIDLSSDTYLAEAIAMGKNATAVKELIDLKKKEAEANKILAATQTLAQNKKDVGNRLDLNSIMNAGKAAGLKDVQMNELMNNTALQDILMNQLHTKGTIDFTAPQVQTALQLAVDKTYIEAHISKFTLEGMEKTFSDGMSKVQESFNAKQHQIELDFKLGTNLSGQNGKLINTALQNKIIQSAQNEIDLIQNRAGGITDLQDGLTRIGYLEDDINKKYDVQYKALDKIQQANDAISQKEKSKITLADALTRGDIAAAAATAQQMRADAAAASLQDRRKALDAAKEAELKAVTISVNGVKMTREQIETRQRALQLQILDIEQSRLNPAKLAVQLADQELQSITDNLTVLGQTKDQWDAIQNKVDMARISGEGYKKSIQDAIDILPTLISKLGEIPSAPSVSVSNQLTSTPPIVTSGTDATQATVATQATQATQATVAPIVTQAPSVTATAARYYTVKSGDSLWGIASKYYGSGAQYMKIYNANKAKIGPNPSLIYAGTKLVIPYSTGGIVGSIAGNYGSIGTDTVPAMLTPGEFVVKKYAVDNFGVDKLKAINNGTFDGGSVYNYNLSVNVNGSNLNADDVARTVMAQIKSIDGQRVQGNRFSRSNKF